MKKIFYAVRITVLTRNWLVVRVRNILALGSGDMSFSLTMYVVGIHQANVNMEQKASALLHR